MGIFQKTDAGDLPLTTRERRLKLRRLLTYGLAAAVGMILAGFTIRVNKHAPASGYVTAEHYAEVRSPVVGLITNILVQSEARVKQGDMLVQLSCAEAQASPAEAAMRAREIRAPIAGQALRYEFVLGELVRPETLLYEIFGGEKQILKLRILERHALRVAVGNRYYAWLTSYRGLQRVRFRGEVQYLRNVIQSDGQTTYRVAFCSFDPQSHAVPPGTTAEAMIYYGKTCLWFFLFGLD